MLAEEHKAKPKILQDVCYHSSSIAEGLFNLNFPSQALTPPQLVTPVDIFTAYHFLFKKQANKKTAQGVHPEKINLGNSHRADRAVKTFLFCSGMRGCLTPCVHSLLERAQPGPALLHRGERPGSLQKGHTEAGQEERAPTCTATLTF